LRQASGSGLHLARTLQFALEPTWTPRLASALRYCAADAQVLASAPRGAAIVALQLAGARSIARASERLAAFNAARGATAAWSALDAAGNEAMAAALFVYEDSGHSLR
jgi:hypothetical protein